MYNREKGEKHWMSCVNPAWCIDMLQLTITSFVYYVIYLACYECFKHSTNKNQTIFSNKQTY